MKPTEHLGHGRYMKLEDIAISGASDSPAFDLQIAVTWVPPVQGKSDILEAKLL
jgi:hypothetical protein